MKGGFRKIKREGTERRERDVGRCEGKGDGIRERKG